MGSSPEFKSFALWLQGRAYFKRDSPLGSLEIGRLRCSKSDMIDLVKRFGENSYRETRSGLWIFDENLHRRLVVFCAAVSGMRRRNPLAVEFLKELSLELDAVSLLFWYSEFVERFRRSGVRSVFRVSRSLRTLYYA